MKNAPHRLDKVLSGKLKGYAAPAAPEAWREFSLRYHGRNKRKLLWPYLLTGLLTLIAIGSSILWLQRPDEMPKISEARPMASGEIVKPQQSIPVMKEETIVDSGNSSVPTLKSTRNSRNQINDKIKNENPLKQGKPLYPFPLMANELSIKSTVVLVIPPTLKAYPEKEAEEQTKPKSNGLQFGITAGTAILDPGEQTAEPARVHEDYLRLQESARAARPGINAGIVLRYNLLPALGVKAGIQYTRYENRMNYDFYKNKIAVVDSATRNILGYITLPNASAEKIDSSTIIRYQYIEIPLEMGYNFNISDRYYLRASLGFSFMKMLDADGAQLESTTLSYRKMEPDNFGRWSTNAKVGMGIGYRFGNGLAIELEPTYHRYGNLLSEQEQVKLVPQAFKINATLLITTELFK
ncbi:MAG: outer membrane beta-barrel protein [Bacteroidia bacterium]